MRCIYRKVAAHDRDDDGDLAFRADRPLPRREAVNSKPQIAANGKVERDFRHTAMKVRCAAGFGLYHE